MPELTAATTSELLDALNRAIEERCRIAFAYGCRLAVTAEATELPRLESQLSTIFGRGADGPPCEITLEWEFVILSPGETPPPGRRWTIYEERGGQAVGRSA